MHFTITKTQNVWLLNTVSACNWRIAMPLYFTLFHFLTFLLTLNRGPLFCLFSFSSLYFPFLLYAGHTVLMPLSLVSLLPCIFPWPFFPVILFSVTPPVTRIVQEMFLFPGFKYQWKMGESHLWGQWTI